MRKIIIIMLLTLFTLGMSADFSNAATAAPAKSSGKASSTTTTAAKKTNKNCTKAAGGYDVCTTAGGVKEIRGYVCRAGEQKINIPTCTVGGIFNMNDPDDVKCACCGQCPLSRFLGLFITISRWILGLSGSAALLVVVYGGFMWILSGGDPGKIEKGKNALTGAVIGVIIVLGAWLMVDQGLKAMTGKGIDGIQSQFKANLK